MGAKATPFKAGEWKQAKDLGRKKETVEAEIGGESYSFELHAPSGREFLELSKDATRRTFQLQKALSGTGDLGNDPSNFSEEQLDALLRANESGVDFYMTLLKHVLVIDGDFTDDDWIDFIQATGGFGSKLALKVYEIAGFKHPQSVIAEGEEALEDDLPLSSEESAGSTPVK